MPEKKRRTRRSFGAMRKLPSGRYQASYLDPNGRRVNAPTTFTTKGDADTWLSLQRAALETGAWRAAPDETTVGQYVETWLQTLTVAHRTRYNYERSIRTWILPTFGTMPMHTVSTVAVRRWVAAFPDNKPAARAQAYVVLGRIFRDAIADGIITETPVKVRGASEYSTARQGHALTVDEVQEIARRMPEAERLSVVLCALCALRPGEVLALRRRDIDLATNTVRVRETASAKIGGSAPTGPTKTEGSVRDVHFPSALNEDVSRQIKEHAAAGPSGHLFPASSNKSNPVPYRTWAGHFKDAAARAKVEDVRPHDLRHTGLTLAAATGATLSELMARAGHTSPTVAAKYQHATRDRDRAIADRIYTAGDSSEVTVPRS